MILSDQSSKFTRVDCEVHSGNINIPTQIYMNLCESVDFAEIKCIPIFKVMHVMTFLMLENTLYFISWILTIIHLPKEILMT